MIWLLAVFLIGYAAWLEWFLQIDFVHDEQTKLDIHLGCLSFRRTWKLALVRTPQGHRLVRLRENGSAAPSPIQVRKHRGSGLWAALRRADRARNFLLRHLHVDKLDALLLLHTGDAARSALLTGGLRGVLACIPPRSRRNVHIRVLPEFFRERSTLQARCIIHFRLGTIMLTAGMLLLDRLREQHLTESEAMPYGTSHR